MRLLEKLRTEKNAALKGGLYHVTQIKLAYNTNRIEGSRLSEEQTRYIYETNTVVMENGDISANVNDIFETVNHFACFDYMLETADCALSEEIVKAFHTLLKSNTTDAKANLFCVGEYKAFPNVVGGMETSKPQHVPADMRNLLTSYLQNPTPTLEDIVDFHFRFERIHPFQDGNGRVGRLIMFKECLAHDITPFIIEDANKFFYYRGLKEYPAIKEYLLDTCRAAQDDYENMVTYFSA